MMVLHIDLAMILSLTVKEGVTSTKGSKMRIAAIILFAIEALRRTRAPRALSVQVTSKASLYGQHTLYSKAESENKPALNVQGIE